MMRYEKGTRAHDRAQRGYSLTELLVTLTVLMLVTAIMATAVPSALRAYAKVVDASNAQVLLATTATRLRDELSMANPDTSTMNLDGSNVMTSFTSLETGYQVTFFSDDMGDLCKREKAVGSGASNDSTAVETPLIPTKDERPGGTATLCATYDSITYSQSKGVFEVNNLRVVKFEPVADESPDDPEEGDPQSSDDDAAQLIEGESFAGAQYRGVLEIRVLAAPQG